MEEKKRPATLVSESLLSSVRGQLDDIECIARGGMSHIYRARQTALNRYVVVKQLREELFSNADMLERFRREARALASVLHQNVAHVYDFVESGNESYILMEYIDGVDLSHVLSKLGQLPAEIAAAIALGIGRGVSYIHAHNLIHRDIKPANVRLTSRGAVKLMDFGIVMNLDHENLTRPGLMVGSPSYLSPEQILGDPITPRADVFLLGIVLYEMLTGTRPFKEEGGKTMFQAIREANFIPVTEMRRSVPRALAKVVNKCLARDPAGRFDSMKAVIQDLEHFLGTYSSAHTEDLVLGFLDREAILSPSIPFLDLDRKGERWVRPGWRYWAVTLLVSALSLSLGYWLRR